MVTRLLCVSLLLVAAVLDSISAVEKRASKPNLCVDQETCGDCLATAPECGWCTQVGFDASNRDRCDFVENLIPAGCDPSNIVSPRNEIQSLQDLEVRNAADGQEAVQLQPQKMSLKLRPNQPYKFPLKFRQAENYPVDLYYVMDLSHSMGDDKAKLAELGDLLAANMSTITSNFHLGFGSFVDKKTMPYVSMVPSRLESPCTGCVAPYGFRNVMRLTDSTNDFRTKVMDAQISGNLDSPEGGFDAIMQAIVCDEEIGWRPSARKMIVYSSDAPFHFAGDGKLGGIVKPNDGACHLENNMYSESLNQDYPSISQLSHKIAEKKVNIIFAVIGSEVSTYESLSEFIEGSTTGELANDSSNVVGLVKDNYEKITSVVEMKTEGANDVIVRFRSACFGTELKDVSKCAELGIGENVTFEVEVEVRECPANREEWQKNFTIYAVGLNEKLEISLDLICECDCELPKYEKVNSPHCNKSGTYECGACTCNKGFYGRNCECARDGSSLENSDYDAACRMTNTSEVCEGHGQCLCGTCDCNPTTPGDTTKRYSGKFCECDDYSCDYYDNKLCGGNGNCKCGQCQCNDMFNGSACECPVSEKPCTAANGLICNGKGTCHCGKCTCNLDTFYRGITCEDCPTCTGKCNQNKACVQCRTFSSGPYSEEYCKANCSFVQIVDHIKDEPNVRKMCQFRDDDDCMFYFAYEYDSETVQVQRTKECPEPVNVLAIVLGVVLGIVFVGLALLLIWKLFTTIQDRREVAKFENDKKMAKWDTGQNPIYKQATSTFKNPMYAGK